MANPEPKPERLRVNWSIQARDDLRTIDRETALQILYCLDRFLTSRTGDVKKLKPPRIDYRLRCGDYRIFFDPEGESAINVTGVQHRKDAYR